MKTLSALTKRIIIPESVLDLLLSLMTEAVSGARHWKKAGNFVTDEMCFLGIFHLKIDCSIEIIRQIKTIFSMVKHISDEIFKSSSPDQGESFRNNLDGFGVNYFAHDFPKSMDIWLP